MGVQNSGHYRPCFVLARSTLKINLNFNDGKNENIQLNCAKQLSIKWFL